MVAVQLLGSIAHIAFPHVKLESAQWEDDSWHETALVLPPPWVTAACFLAGWTFAILAAHFANRQLYMCQLQTFEALYVLLMFSFGAVMKHVSMLSLYWKDAGDHTWYWQLVLLDLGILPVAFVIAALDSVAIARKWKVGIFGAVAVACLTIYARTYVEQANFSEFGGCAFGVPCKDYLQYFRTALLNVVIFISKMGWSYLTTGCEVANIRPRYRVTFHDPADANAAEFVRLGALLQSAGRRDFTKNFEAISDVLETPSPSSKSPISGKLARCVDAEHKGMHACDVLGHDNFGTTCPEGLGSTPTSY